MDLHVTLNPSMMSDKFKKGDYVVEYSIVYTKYDCVCGYMEGGVTDKSNSHETCEMCLHMTFSKIINFFTIVHDYRSNSYSESSDGV